MKNQRSIAALALAVTGAIGCAGSDNPTALADLEPVAELDLSVQEVETMLEVEIVTRVREGGGLMHLRDVRLEVNPPFGPARIMELAGDEDGYSAHVRFYEPGEHHLRLHGRPERHNLSGEMGEFEVHAERQHQILDDHRFELSVSPAPAIPGVPARITLYAWEMEHDGSLGHEAEGLALHATVHLPGGAETDIELRETDHGIYEGDLVFPVAGSYDLALEIEGAGEPDHSVAAADPEEEDDDDHGEGAEFEIHVPAPDGETAPPAEEDDGHGH